MSSGAAGPKAPVAPQRCHSERCREPPTTTSALPSASLASGGSSSTRSSATPMTVTVASSTSDHIPSVEVHHCDVDGEPMIDVHAAGLRGELAEPGQRSGRSLCQALLVKMARGRALFGGGDGLWRRPDLARDVGQECG